MREAFHLIGCCLLLLLVAAPARTAAHVLKQDHGISGVLHLPPDDAPLAGQPTKLNVAFGDTKQAFSLAACNCQVIVKSNNRVVQIVGLQPYSKDSTLNSTAIIRFPDIGVYDVIIRGRPTDGSFLSFQLDYLVRVTAATGSQMAPAGSGSAVIIIGLGSLTVLGLLAYVNIRDGGRYISLPPGKPHKIRRQ